METWLTQHFVNSALVYTGAMMVAAPIIIHLINRFQYKRVHFAAMEFLLQSQQTNQRRVLLEQLLLLLLRIFLIICLLLLIARLILDPNQLSMFHGAKSHHVIVLDDSGSMQNVWGEQNAFDEGLQVIRKIAAEGANRPNTEKFSLILLSRADAPLFLQRDINEELINELDAKLSNLTCSHQSLDLNKGLEVAADLLNEDRAVIKTLHLISDFRKSDWQEKKGVASTIENLSNDDVAINLVKTVPDSQPNLAITELSGATEVAAVNVPLRLRVSIKNFGDQVANDVRVSAFDDQNKLPMSIVFDKIEAGSEISQDFDVVFNKPDLHQINVSLTNDALGGDNQRFLSIAVKPSNPVLIIDGNPSGNEWMYIQTAIAPDASTTGFAPSVESVDYLRRHPLDQFKNIYLLNVAELPLDAVSVLEKFVSEGGGLVWFVGPSVQAAFYNDKLFKEGKGLFPAPLEMAPRDLPARETNTIVDMQVSDHPLFSVFAGQDNPLIEAVTISKYFPLSQKWLQTEAKNASGVNIIATLRNQAPFIIEHRFGKGRIITCLTSAGPIATIEGEPWNSWALNPSYIVFQLELQKYLVQSRSHEQAEIVGDPITFSLDAAVFSDEIQIQTPISQGERTIRLKASPKQESNASENGSLKLDTTYRETDQPGIYSVQLKRQDQTVEQQMYAFNFPSTESNLELATSEELFKALGNRSQIQIQEPGEFQWIQGQEAGREITNSILVILFLILICEQLLAYRLSYHPQTASAAA
ncbi:BatA domain-containing protein [uncultured Gimesia sp.]|uniref:BatA domain-containing protein n=1 Tax=uncultured Gimesia sp. TaxID=1678688 RepID=UPI00261C79DF|nr:BatA domain-containing protein [uncultured Gimesia sp.]